MSHAQRYETSTRPSRAWAGWLTFAAVILTLIGLSAYPIWSAIMILLDILVIFALTARWDEAQAAM
jgi:hypothetical protein